MKEYVTLGEIAGKIGLKSYFFAQQWCMINGRKMLKAFNMDAKKRRKDETTQ